MHKDFIKNSGYTFVRFFGILWLSMLICILAYFIIPFWIPREQTTVNRLIRACILFFPTFGGCFFLAKSDGYKNERLLQKNELKKYAFVLLLHVLYGFLFRFAIYTNGAVYDIAHMIWAALGNKVHGIGSAPFWLYLSLLIAFDCIYLLAVMWGRKTGVQKRVRDRMQLTSKQ